MNLWVTSCDHNCSNNYGPYHHPEKLIPHIIISALEKTVNNFWRWHSGDWLYVDDHAKALLSSTEAEIGETLILKCNETKY